MKAMSGNWVIRSDFRGSENQSAIIDRYKLSLSKTCDDAA
jgi:hypothetical protein